MSDQDSVQDVDVFKNVFKFYKSRNKIIDLSDVIDFNEVDNTRHHDKISTVNLKDNMDKVISPEDTMKPICEWEAYNVSACPGFIFIKNPFTPAGQRYWIQQCLRYYPCKPNISNLDAHVAPNSIDNMWTRSSYVDTHQNNSSKDLIDRLRWVTLGYHHNWDTKVYSESMRTEFPPNLSRLSKAVATATGHHKFEAQAAIVNFYHMHSSLSGHTDHSEIHMEEPIISFSFGQSAIFLLGGSTKAVPPVPIILRSGDVAVMAGASRSAYHAVPRILPTDNCHVADLYHDCTAADEAFGKYIASARININVRQVLPPGQKFMSGSDGSATTCLAIA